MYHIIIHTKWLGLRRFVCIYFDFQASAKRFATLKYIRNGWACAVSYVLTLIFKLARNDLLHSNTYEMAGFVLFRMYLL